MVRMFTLLVLLTAAAWPAALRAQTTSMPPVRSTWVHVRDDSLRLEYSTPSLTGKWPTVIVLSDRFGVGNGVRGVLKILARMGMLAYAVPLRSATAPQGSGTPPVALDSLDVEALIEATAEISTRGGSNGHISLLGFDIGASVAIRAASRMPFYKSCVLMYPAFAAKDLEEMLKVHCRMQLHLPQFGSALSLEEIGEVRERFIENGKHVHVRYYKEASAFFFNPEHENYHKKNTQIAWNELLEYLRSSR